MYTNLKNYLHKLLKSSRVLLSIIIIVNMIPSICLMFSEPYNFWGKIVLLLCPLGIYLIVFSLWKKIGIIQLILIPILLLHAFQIVLFYLFGEGVISPDMFLNVVTTNTSEASELLNGIWPAIVLVIVIYGFTIVMSIVGVSKKVRTTIRLRSRNIIIGIIFLILSTGFSFVSKNVNTKKFLFKQCIYPANMIYNLCFAVKKYHKTTKYPIETKDFSFHAVKKTVAKQREIYVIVVGETGRAKSWQMFGYDRPTNPLLSKEKNLICFKDAITQCNATYKSVPIILSPASAENYEVVYHQKSILEAFNEIGFKTIFLSNQAPNHSFTELYWKEADYFKNKRSLTDDGSVVTNNFDDSLLPLLKNYIDSIPGNLFIVLHTYGSHFNYKDRYPKTFSIYKPDNVCKIEKKERQRLINAYDNSIVYTDNFLDQVIQILKQSNSCSAMFYTPDHGEDIMDDDRCRFLHASFNPTFYQLWIPMIMWYSDNYQENFPEKVKCAHVNSTKPLATNVVFHTMLDIAGINSPYLQSDLSVVNPTFKIRKRMYIDNLDKPVFFYNANLKKEDKDMIRKYKLYY